GIGQTPDPWRGTTHVIESSRVEEPSHAAHLEDLAARGERQPFQRAPAPARLVQLPRVGRGVAPVVVTVLEDVGLVREAWVGSEGELVRRSRAEIGEAEALR